MKKPIDYADIFRKDLVEFREVTEKFYRGEVSVGDYKGFSGGFGTYAQRGANQGMLRLRLYGGRIPKEHLNFIWESVEKYNIDLIHFTTCQTIQLHDLDAITICTLVEEAWDHGIMTRGGGGDYPRNIMMSPLSGTDKNEAFDLGPYVEATSDYLLTFIDTVRLPRKLKVCFSNTPENYPHATYRDLGFVANENHTFDVYSAGGLGRSPMLGVKVAENIDPADILNYVRAMVDMFVTYGDYKNRGRARTRFIQEDLGPAGYQKEFLRFVAEAQKNYDLSFPILFTPVEKMGPISDFVHKRAISQKQTGLYSVYYHPPGGNLSRDILALLKQKLSTYDSVEIRLTPDQGCYIINCTAKEAQELIELTSDHSGTDFESSVACIGSRICQVGISDSQGFLFDCLKAVEPYHFANHVLPAIHISGCPSSCGTHQTAAMGFRGGVKQTPEGPRPAYAIYLNGSSLYGLETISPEHGLILASRIPDLLIELGTAITNARCSFHPWVAAHKEEFLAIVENYTAP
ncbi:MAG: nitrite/sulfite reductase [Lachnospiraceae bacterium]